MLFLLSKYEKKVIYNIFLKFIRLYFGHPNCGETKIGMRLSNWLETIPKKLKVQSVSVVVFSLSPFIKNLNNNGRAVL